MEQIPNFVLAAPVLLLTAAGVWEYTKTNFRFVLFGGFPCLSTLLTSKGFTYPSAFFGPKVAVHIYPWFFMACVSFFLMHVQVRFRFVTVRVFLLGI